MRPTCQRLCRHTVPLVAGLGGFLLSRCHVRIKCSPAPPQGSKLRSPVRTPSSASVGKERCRRAAFSLCQVPCLTSPLCFPQVIAAPESQPHAIEPPVQADAPRRRLPVYGEPTLPLLSGVDRLRSLLHFPIHS
jgi:hypothetical protein